MPSTHLAFLRGINVGRAKRIAMADLRSVVEGLGFADVRTLLNSGNVIFSAERGKERKASERIHAAIRDELGVDTRVTVLSAADLDGALAQNPLAKLAHDPSRFLIGVLADPADMQRLRPLARKDWCPESLALGTRVAYLWCADGVLKSRIWGAVNAELGEAVTARNLTTMTKLVVLAKGE